MRITLGTVGPASPGEGSTPGSRNAPPARHRASERQARLQRRLGPPLRARHEPVGDATRRCRKARGRCRYTAAGLANIKGYDPEKDGDYTGMCMPFGLMRSINSPYPIQIMQNDKYVAFLFEQSTWFHVVPFKDAHSEDPNPTWFGESIARWDGDTLVVDTIGFNGFTRLDTRGNPHSDKLHLVQTFRRSDAGHIAYTVTVDDPVYYAKPWTNERTFTLTNGELIEYSCEENNRSLWEGRIKIWGCRAPSRCATQ